MARANASHPAIAVAPRAGAWVEIRAWPMSYNRHCRVAPRAGAWVEICRFSGSRFQITKRSLLVQERGLKSVAYQKHLR